MKRFILRVMACLMVAAMICTSFGVTKASAAEGKFSGAYVGSYSAEFIPGSAFEGCENGAVVTFTLRKATAEEGWENPYWQFVFIDEDPVDGWVKLLDESLYEAGGRPAYNPYDFADVSGDTATATFSAAGVAEFLANGKLGIQVAGIVLIDWTVTPVAAEEPVEEPAETPAEEPVEEPKEEPVVTPVETPVEEPVEEPAEEPETSDNTTSGREVKEGETVYTVQKGDCLWAIARQFLGNGSKYTELFDRNGDILTDATVIIPGQEIIIPAK